MKKLLDSDWLRTVQFFLNTVQKRGYWMQKKGNKASILIGQWTKKFTDSQSNLLFSNQACALDGAIMAQFFLDCVIIKITWGLARAQNWEDSSESVKFKTSFTQIFSCILLISNHTVFLVQFGIILHLWVFQKAKLHSPKRLVQFQLFEKLTRTN